MTCSTSDVAVCCSSDSVSSRVRCCSASNSRTFSMAITAWSAKVVTSSICLSVKGRTDFRPKVDDADRRSFAQERDAKKRPRCANPAEFGIRVFGIGQNVEDMNDFAFKQDAPGYRSTVDRSWVTATSSAYSRENP